MSSLSKALLLIIIGFGLLVTTLVVGNLLINARAQARLNGKLAAIHEAGQPITLAELAPKPINAEQNAAVHLERIAKSLKGWETQFLHEFEETKLGKSWGNANYHGSLPSAEQVAAMEPILAAYPTILPAFEHAAAVPRYASLQNYSVRGGQFIANILPEIQLRRSLVNFVTTKMKILGAQGKRDEAVTLGVEMLRLTRHFDEEPLLVSYLVNCAVRGITIEALNSVLQSGPIGAAARTQLNHELVAQDAGQPLVKALQAERAASEAFLADNSPPLVGFLGWPTKNWHADLIDYYNDAIDAISEPYFESHQKVAQVSSQAATGSTYVKLLAPSINSAFVAENRTVAQLHCLRILNAINGYIQNHDREPAGIEELGLTETAMVDPFMGKSLQLKRIENGWLIYSAFQNGIDDGGDFKDMKDWGLAPAGYQQEPESEDNAQQTDQ